MNAHRVPHWVPPLEKATAVAMLGERNAAEHLRPAYEENDDRKTSRARRASIATTSSTSPSTATTTSNTGRQLYAQGRTTRLANRVSGTLNLEVAIAGACR